MLQLEVLILELLAIDALSTSAIATGEVTSLNHEVLDNAVEGRALVTKALLAGSKSSEVLGGLYSIVYQDRVWYIWREFGVYLWHGLAVQSNSDTPKSFLSMLDVEVDLVGDLWTLLSLNSLCEVDESKGEHHQEGGEESL